MKKKGFTLIELLAVIVVLALIALISVPLILGIIEKAKKGALTSTANGLLESATLYYAKNLAQVSENQVFLFDETHEGETLTGLKLSYKGDFNGTGTLRIYKDGKSAICIQEGNYFALKNVEDTKVITGTGLCSYDETTNSYLSINLVSQEIVDELQSRINELEAGKEAVTNALINKGVSITLDDDLNTIADILNNTTIGKRMISLGAGTSFDLKTNYATYGLSATDYQSLTADNFIISVQTINASGYCTELSWSGSSSASANVNKSYNNTTGVLTVSNISASGGYSGSKYGSGGYGTTLVINTYIVY
ncbi:MAG: type II secretion system protein [Bacilli bacterium]|nr:type II secretion system protein [Bacilli bacterium]